MAQAFDETAKALSSKHVFNFGTCHTIVSSLDFFYSFLLMELQGTPTHETTFITHNLILENFRMSLAAYENGCEVLEVPPNAGYYTMSEIYYAYVWKINDYEGFCKALSGVSGEMVRVHLQHDMFSCCKGKLLPTCPYNEATKTAEQ